MEFVLNEYHRNIPDDELLEDLKRVAYKLDKATITREEYKVHGKYGYTTYQKRFGGWNKALILCGLTPNALQIAAAQSKPLYLSISDEDLLRDVHDVAIQLGKDQISSGEYARYGKFSKDTCFKRFGTWEHTLEKAGLKKYVQVSGRRIRDEVLLEEIERLWIQLGRQPTATDIRNGMSQYTLNTYTRHFKGWRGALEAFIQWINSDKSDQSVVLCERQMDTVKAPVSTVRVSNMVHTTARDINLRLRFKIMHRDNFKCRLCGSSPANDPSVKLHIDHIVPWSRGGETVMENLQTLCSKCNLGKSDLTIE